MWTHREAYWYKNHYNVINGVELESIGIIDDQQAKWSLDEESALSQFKKSLKFDGERYEVALPWKENHPKLRDNYKQTVK